MFSCLGHYESFTNVEALVKFINEMYRDGLLFINILYFISRQEKPHLPPSKKKKKFLITLKQVKTL